VSVLVTDGNQRSTLAVVRALGHGGIPVTVGESQSSSLAGVSRHCARRICYPSPVEEGEHFLAFLYEELRGGQYNLLLPMTDITMQLIASARESLSPMVRVPFPGQAQVNLVQDKRHMLLLARQVGIACPETFLLDETESLEAIAARIRFPAVVKPRFSRFCRNGKWVSGSVQYARDLTSLVAEYDRIHKLIPYPMVQEKIEGEGRGVFLLIWNGELKAAFCHRRLREKPPWGGVSVYCESLPPDHGLVEKSYALLKALGWQGVAMVEFKVDRRDGQPKLMEVNGRFWGSLQLAIDAGMNFPLLLYRLAMKDDVPAQFEYKAGVKSRWLLGDLDHLLIRFKHARTLNGSPLSGPSRLRTLIDFMKFYERHLHYTVLRLDDPAPGWHEIKSYVQNGLRRVASRGKEEHAS
jgi:predicted ATP-grasp superfamily ATP-dependent carboligase